MNGAVREAPRQSFTGLLLNPASHLYSYGTPSPKRHGVTAQPVVQKPGFSRAGMVFVCATAFHGAMILVCETKTRFLMPCLSSYLGF